MNPAALGHFGVYSAYAALAALAVTALKIGLAAPAGPARAVAACTPVLLVVAAAVAHLYAMLFSQSAAAFVALARLRGEAKARGERGPTLAEVKYGGNRPDAVLAADRCVGNYVEQLVPFLCALLAHAVFVSANGATQLGWLWLFFRSYYPLAYARPFPMLLLSTMPAYACLWWMMGSAVYHAVAQMP